MNRTAATGKLRAWREERRLDRRFRTLARTIPAIGGPVEAVRPGGRASILRIPVSLLLIAGGIFSFLPGLGIWMLPLGLLLLAVDVPVLRRPVSTFMIRGQRLVQGRWRAWFRRPA